MNKKVYLFLTLVLLCVSFSCNKFLHEFTNDNYHISVMDDGSLQISSEKSSNQVFKPEFMILYSETDPELALRPNRDIKGISYNIATWDVNKVQSNADIKEIDTSVVAGDGLDPRILKGERIGRTENYFESANKIVVRAVDFAVEENSMNWNFEENSLFRINASLNLTQEKGAPQLTFKFTPKKNGWFSIGYIGAPAYSIREVDEIWQPFLWQEKRFPDKPYLTMAFRCPIPTTLITKRNTTIGVVADPSHIPFIPLPKLDNSQFGVMVRNEDGMAQPLLFAPVMGGLNSNMKEKEIFTFKMHLVVENQSLVKTHEHLARDLFKFKDYRSNSFVSVNTTLENMIDYGMSTYSRFNEEMRGCSYSTDAPGTVKNVSALNPLSLALVTDNDAIYYKRARPIMEYILSREKFLFTPDPSIKIQNPSWKLYGPCAPVSELVALYQLSNNKSSVFLKHARELYKKSRVLNLEEKTRGDKWENALAFYRLTGDMKYLKKAKNDADDYINTRMNVAQKDFGNSNFFWTAFAPKWISLYDLYEETGELKYLENAVEGAYRYMQFMWFNPVIPDKNVTVNRGGKAPMYWYMKSKGHKQMYIPEETVPAWRLSEIALTPESSGTCQGHRGIFMANPIPWMLRLSLDAGNKFFHDISRSVVIGRYSNFPGYHMNTARTTIYEKPDYPIREHDEFSYNSIHYNHIWPQASMLLDYLVSDVYYKSEGKIEFPGLFAEGYAYLQSKVYGHKSGKFYDDENVWLWMPKNILDVDNVEINYLTGHGNGNFYIALTNQSKENVTTELTINNKYFANTDFSSFSVDSRNNNHKMKEMKILDGSISVTVPASGITSLVVSNLQPKLSFQTKIGQGVALSDSSYTELNFAGANAMMLSMGDDYTSVYVYLKSTFEEVSEAILWYKSNDEWKNIRDSSYPYEFTVDLAKPEPFEFYIETMGIDGEQNKSKIEVLKP